MFQLTDQTALITGASGSIGSAIARAFHAQGATIAISGTRIESFQALANELRQKDAKTDAYRAAHTKKTGKRLGRID